jgi:hypothetical protein
MVTNNSCDYSPTIHNVQVGGSSGTLTNVAPSATSGIPLISQGAASDPAFGTAVVAGGGTGAITLTGVLTGNGTSPITASTVTQHGVLVGGASNAVSSTAVGSTGQVLQANTGADPTYSTATYPSTTTVNQILYSSSANTVGGLATVNRAVLATTSGGVPAWIALTDGQLVIGSTAGAPAAAALSAGTGITITNASNSITIAATSGGFTWTDENGAFNALAQNGYHIFGTCTATLPSAPNNGDTIKFFIDGAFVLTIQASAGKTIQFGTNVSSSAGTQANTASGDACELVYRTTDTKWCAVSFVGAWNKT